MLEGFKKMKLGECSIKSHLPRLALRGKTAVFNRLCVQMLGSPRAVDIWYADDGKFAISANNEGATRVVQGTVVARSAFKEWVQKFIPMSSQIYQMGWDNIYVYGEWNEAEKAIIFDLNLAKGDK